MTAREARALTRGKNHVVEAHHLLEQRHMIRWGMADQIDDSPAVVLRLEEHQPITKDLQNRLSYGRTYTKEEVWAEYQQAYRKYPDWLEAIRRYFK